jgi:hypothetical protein
MLDKILFWVVLVWMITMLVMAIIAVREVWRDAAKPEPEGDASEGPPSAPGSDPAPRKS